jgi:hypothetical protein
MSFVPVSSNVPVSTVSVVSPTFSKRSWADEETDDDDEELNDELIKQEINKDNELVEELIKLKVSQEIEKPKKNFKFYLGVQSHDAKKMALIHNNNYEGLKFKSNGQKNNFDNYNIFVEANNKNDAIQIAVDFLTTNSFHHKTIEIFKNKALFEGPKTNKKQIISTNSSSTDEVISTKEKYNYILYFSCFKNSVDAEKIKNNIEVLKFVSGKANDKFDNYTVIVNATDKDNAIKQIVSELKTICISTKTIENFINKSK